MNEEEKKAIERLKEIEVNTYAEGKARTIDTILNLIAKLQKENEEWQKAYQEEKDSQFNLIKENQTLKTFVSGIFNENIEKDFIPVQKVKDKISERQFELQQEYKNFEDDAILIVLQELLEGRK